MVGCSSSRAFQRTPFDPWGMKIQGVIVKILSSRDEKKCPIIAPGLGGGYILPGSGGVLCVVAVCDPRCQSGTDLVNNNRYVWV